MTASTLEWSSPLLVDQALQRHLLQVGYVDRLRRGSCVRRSRQRPGSYDRALVIVTADHGVELQARRLPADGRRRRISPTSRVYRSSSSTRASIAGSVDRRDAKTIDILPTIADVVGVRIPWHVDGHLAPRGAGERAAR